MLMLPQVKRAKTMRKNKDKQERWTKMDDEVRCVFVLWGESERERE